jgi:hypothetical protein
MRLKGRPTPQLIHRHVCQLIVPRGHRHCSLSLLLVLSLWMHGLFSRSWRPPAVRQRPQRTNQPQYRGQCLRLLIVRQPSFTVLAIQPAFWMKSSTQAASPLLATKKMLGDGTLSIFAAERFTARFGRARGIATFKKDGRSDSLSSTSTVQPTASSTGISRISLIYTLVSVKATMVVTLSPTEDGVYHQTSLKMLAFPKPTH